MIAIMEKYEHNTDFHQIVDFVEASQLMYALTINPTVYVSHIRQFWSITRIKTTDERTKILATVDGKLRTISESPIRRNLKLRDEAGISSLPDAKLFENLTLMGYNILPNQKFSFQKGQFSHQWKYLIHTIMQCLSPKSTGFNEFSSNIATALVCLATNRVYNFSKMIFDDEPASPIRDDSQGEACPTISGLEAEQDRANITKTSTLPSDLTPRVTSLATDEGSDLATLKARIQHLEDRDGGDDDPSGEDVTIKGRRLETGEEAGIERSTEKGSNDIEEMVNVLTSLDATSVLSSGVQVSIPPAAEVPTVSVPPATINVPTGSSVVPTASPIFTTATVATPYTRKKGKEKMVESETPKKKKLQEQMDVEIARQLEEEMERDAQRMNEQIARDAEIARIHAEEELQIMIDGLDRNNETVAKYLQEYYQFAAGLPIRERIELIKESERFKRKGISLEQEGAKKVKTLEEVLEEDLKDMMQLVPVEEVYVEALQHFDREDLNQLWELVNETLNIRQAANDKENELWVEMKRTPYPRKEVLRDSYEAPKDGAATGSSSDGKKGRTVVVTTKDMQKRRNDVKARTTLLLALLDEHQLRLAKIEQDDLNQKFLTSLAPEWLMHMIVWRNRSDLDTMSLDDLYDHLKVYEPEVQKKSESNSQKIAFISTAKNNSGNGEVNTTDIPTASTQISPAGSNVATASISLDTACAYIASQSNESQIKYEDINQIDEDDIEEMDIKWNMALLSMRADRY
nr:ribonuclease H-like domain-containing protein [Tanacetum cinerariifolium]